MFTSFSKYGVSTLHSPGAMLHRQMSRAKLPNSEQKGFKLEHVPEDGDFFLAEKTDDGWQAVTELPKDGVSRHDIGKYGVWKDQGVQRRSFIVAGPVKEIEKPDGEIQDKEVTPLTYGSKSASIGTPLLGAEILEGHDGEFHLRTSAQPADDKGWKRLIGLGDSSKGHHDGLVADDLNWIIRA